MGIKKRKEDMDPATETMSNNIAPPLDTGHIDTEPSELSVPTSAKISRSRKKAKIALKKHDQTGTNLESTHSGIDPRGLRFAPPEVRALIYKEVFEGSHLVYILPARFDGLPAMVKALKDQPSLFREALAAWGKECIFHIAWSKDIEIEWSHHIDPSAKLGFSGPEKSAPLPELIERLEIMPGFVNYLVSLNY